MAENDDRPPAESSGRRARLKSAFNAALSLPSRERSRYLDRLRAGSASMAREVSRYLRHYHEAGDFLEPEERIRPVAFKASELVAERFRIVRLIGQGGMGEVYEAIDLVAREPVALKTIRPDFAADAATRARFIIELQLARRVAHTNVCRAHEMWREERNGQELAFLTMELLEGETMAALLKREGQLTPAAALPLLEQLVAALDAIHQLNIIHRDLKPSNVHLVPGGESGPRVVVTDFGLARLTVGDATRTTGLAGTPAYMAPEQFERGECSVASDVYAFGVICFEMLTGQRQPLVPARQVNPGLDQAWEDFILRCIAQDPKKRPVSAQALLDELTRLRDRRRLRTRLAGRVAAMGLLAAAVTVSTMAALRGGRSPANAAEFTRLTFDPGLSWDVGATAEGSRIVYSSDRGAGGGFQIWQQQMRTAGGEGGGDPAQLTFDAGHAVSPALSPDGRLVAYRAEARNGGVDIVPSTGGAARRIGPYGRQPRFSPDGTRVVYWTGVEGDHALPSGKLWIVGTTGGPPRQLHPALVDARFPAWSPDGRWILFRGSTTPGSQWDSMSDWYVTDPEGRKLVATRAFAAFSEAHLSLHDGGVVWQPNEIVFAARTGHSTNLWAIGISGKTGLVTGPPERLTSGSNLETSPWPISGGVLAYTNWGASAQIWRVWTAGEKAGQAERVTETDALDTRPSVSVDGRTLIFTRRLGEARNLWSKDLVSGKETSLVSGMPLVPAVSPDGTMVAYSLASGAKRSIWLKPTSGGDARSVCDDCGEVQGWSSAATHVLYVRQTPTGGRALERLDLETSRTQTLTIDDTVSEGSFSPDDQMIAFSIRTGGIESRIYVAPTHGGGPTPRAAWRAVNPAGEWADKPRWSADGRALLYFSTRDGFGCLWRQPLEAGIPQGAPEAVHHIHDARHAILHLSRQAFSMAPGPDFVVYNAPNAGGNIWMMSPRAPSASGASRWFDRLIRRP